MKLWLFIFTNPTANLVSARVAAHREDQAYEELGVSKADRSIICAFAGEADYQHPGTISFITRAFATKGAS